MLTAAIFLLFFSITNIACGFLLAIFPTYAFATFDVSSIIDLIRKATIFVPADIFLLLLTSVVTWYVAKLVWAVYQLTLGTFPFFRRRWGG